MCETSDIDLKALKNCTTAVVSVDGVLDIVN